MLYVGLTGNIASGKSEVTHLFSQWGATIIDADLLAREAVEPGSPAFEQIVSRWGNRVVSDDGTLDRATLRKIVFGDRAQLDELNEIVHPRVNVLRDTKVHEAATRGDTIVVYAIPLLFETGMGDEFDAIVLVDAPKHIRLERLMKTRGLDAIEAMNMITAQMPTELKRPKSTFVINNDGSLEHLERQTHVVWNALQAKASAPDAS